MRQVTMAKDDAFKSSFINRQAELEVDKLFRALREARRRATCT